MCKKIFFERNAEKHSVGLLGKLHFKLTFKWAMMLSPTENVH